MRLRLGLMFVQLDRLHLFKMNETCCFRPKRFPHHGGVFLFFLPVRCSVRCCVRAAIRVYVTAELSAGPPAEPDSAYGRKETINH